MSLRGNVETRLNQALEGQLDAVVLAWAGLQRLGLVHHITQRLGPPRFLPAVGQGALGLECRAGEAVVEALVKPLTDESTFRAVLAERAALAALQGGCTLPIAAWARDLIAQDAAQLSGTWQSTSQSSTPMESSAWWFRCEDRGMTRKV